MNYYERHLGDYAKDTGHLTMLEHGAYTLLLDRYYSSERGIEADHAYRIARARSKEERAAVDAVLAEFFVLTDGVWTKKRVEDEIAKYRESEPDREAKRENERERQRRTRERRKQLFDLLREHGVVPAYDAPMSELQRLVSQLESRDQSHDVTHAVTRDVTATQTPDTRHQRNTPQPPKGFDEFWAAYPSKVAKGAAEKAFAKLRPTQDLLRQMLDAIEAQKGSARWRGGYIPNPSTWLNQTRWLDESAANDGGAPTHMVGVI